jgi:hypothetical protein
MGIAMHDSLGGVAGLWIRGREVCRIRWPRTVPLRRTYLRQEVCLVSLVI